MLREFEITCPTCKGWILIDLDSGEVLKHGAEKESRKKAKVDPAKFTEAFGKVREREQGGGDLFDDAVRAVKKSKQKLEDAFEEAKRKAKENPDERPPNPFDVE